MRAGADLTRGQHRDLVGEVECMFSPVDPKWIKQLMDWAIWTYYDGADFPVLQAVYPDLENRFPEDSGFDKGFEQPLYAARCSHDSSRERFLGLNRSQEDTLQHGKFPELLRTILQDLISLLRRRFTTKGTEPVTYVSHDAKMQSVAVSR